MSNLLIEWKEFGIVFCGLDLYYAVIPMRESRLVAYFQRPTHYYATFGLAIYDERVHIKVIKIIPPSRLAAWVLNKRAKVEEFALRVPYERIHRLHDLISAQTTTYFDRKKRRGYAHATRQLEQFVRETGCRV